MEEVKIFAVKTTANQERSVADAIERYARNQNEDIRSLLVPWNLKGYVLVESPRREIVEHMIRSVHHHHLRTLVKGETSLEEIQQFLIPKSPVVGVSEGMIVELISGPFKGERARIKSVDMERESVTVELLDAVVPIPVTVRASHIRVLSKEEK